MLILLYKSCVACTVVYQNSKIQHHLLIKVLLTTSIKVVKIKNFKFPPKCVQERLKMPFIRESKFKFFCPSAPPPCQLCTMALALKLHTLQSFKT